MAKAKRKAPGRTAVKSRARAKPKPVPEVEEKVWKEGEVEELRDSNPVFKALFWEVVRGDKPVEDLNEKEIRALIIRVGYLSDDERLRFAPVLVRENLSEKDVDRYGKLQTLDRYFPVGKE